MIFGLFSKKPKPAAVEAAAVWPWPDNVLSRTQALGMIRIAIRAAGASLHPNDPHLPPALLKFVTSIDQRLAINTLWANEVKAVLLERGKPKA